MRLTHAFIDRPILATVLSVFITILGLGALATLPIAQYPEIVPPTVQISAVYPGASAETVSKTVATPIEQEVNGVENMIYMSSQSTGDGKMTLTVTFKIGTDLNVAQMLTQNRVQDAVPRLPDDVQRLGVTVRKATPNILMAVHMMSPDNSRDELYLSNFATLHVKDALTRLAGVGDVQLFGGARLCHAHLARSGPRRPPTTLKADEVLAALRAQNVQVSGRHPQPAAGAHRRRLPAEHPDAGAALHARAVRATCWSSRTRPGHVTRIRDLGRVAIGAADYGTDAFLDHGTGLPLLVFSEPGANSLAVESGSPEHDEGAATDLPGGRRLPHRLPTPTVFVGRSVHEVVKTIFVAIALVVGVVLLFLQTWRATLIPVIAIPVSLIGTFVILAILGISLNNLSLFGLVLAVGIVVDDAIVVVENVERNMQAGMSPREAAHRTMDEVGGALIAIALTLCAVFVPSAFLSGISGQFFRQFAVTIVGVAR